MTLYLRVLALLVLLVSTGCGSSQADRPVSKSRSSPSASKSSRVVVIVMENQEYGDVIGSSAAPYINRLARRYALATNFYGASHPSLPNYLALTGGATFGISSDCTGCHVSGKNLVDELESAGISWKAYMEDMPTRCYKGASAGAYAKKHDPFVYYDNVVDNRRRCSKVVPYPELARDLSGGRLPKFAWISPNLCHDMHDCSVNTGDTYLARLVPSLVRKLGPHGVLFLTWDEGSSDRGCCKGAAGGHIPTIVAGPDVRAGERSNAPYDHYSTLRTISELLRIPPLRQANCTCTKPLDALFSHRPTL
jgi:phosphatidylinositol-3-phosphatase